jgi:hypothetical protein
LEDYHGTSKDLDEVNVLKLNDALTLRMQGEKKHTSNNLQGSLKDLNNLNDLDLNGASMLKLQE